MQSALVGPGWQSELVVRLEPAFDSGSQAVVLFLRPVASVPCSSFALAPFYLFQRLGKGVLFASEDSVKFTL